MRYFSLSFALLLLGGCLDSGSPLADSSPSPSTTTSEPSADFVLNHTFSVIERVAFALELSFDGATNCTLTSQLYGHASTDGSVDLLMGSSYEPLRFDGKLRPEWSYSVIASALAVQANGFGFGNLASGGMAWTSESRASTAFAAGSTWSMALFASRLDDQFGPPRLSIECDKPVHSRQFDGPILGVFTPGHFSSGYGVHTELGTMCNETGQVQYSDGQVGLFLFHTPYDQGNDVAAVHLEGPQIEYDLTLDGSAQHGYFVGGSPGSYSVDCSYVGGRMGLYIVAMGFGDA